MHCSLRRIKITVQSNKVDLQKFPYILYYIYQIYNMNISITKTKTITFQAEELSVRLKIAIDNKIIVQVRHFISLGCDIA